MEPQFLALGFRSSGTYRRVVTSSALLAAAAGLGLGLSLIVAIGAQNAFVLRQGRLGEHVAAVVAVCVASDAVLIVAGVAGAGAVLTAAPSAITVVRIAGAAFLLAYGALAARRVLSRPADGAPARRPRGLLPVLATCMALTWLNPHVYLNTVVLLGSVGAGRGGQRWCFAAGAAIGSLLWFTLLGGGAAGLRPLFARPRAWRVLDGVIAAVMATLGIGLLVA